jgi:BASS family bile acid:Na+ symporter
MSLMQLAGPAGLFMLMMIVGLELTPADFRRVLRDPRAVIGGTLGQILMLPLMTWAVVGALDVNPVFGAGAILVAVSPGAGMSNILTAFARANIALSVTLTAVSSVLAVVTLPFVASIGMEVFLGEAADVEVPVLTLVAQLIAALLVPISLGMGLRARSPELAKRIAPTLQRITFGAIIVFVALGIAFAPEEQLSFDGTERALVAAAVWTLAAMAIGWGIALALRLDASDRFTFLIEFSARNIAVASIVAMSGLGRIDLTLFSGVYAATGYPLAAIAVVVRRRAQARARAADVAG